MSALGDDFRRRAEEHNKTAAELLASSNFQTDPKVQASVVIAKTTANMLSIAGEIVDYLRGAGKVDGAAARRKAMSERFEALRNAYVTGAATGDYSRYDQLVEQLTATLGGNREGGGEGGSGK